MEMRLSSQIVTREDQRRSCLLGSREWKHLIVFPGENQIWVNGATWCAAPPHIVHTACSFAEWEMDVNWGTPISDNVFLSKGSLARPRDLLQCPCLWAENPVLNPCYPNVDFDSLCVGVFSRCWKDFPQLLFPCLGLYIRVYLYRGVYRCPVLFALLKSALSLNFFAELM